MNQFFLPHYKPTHSLSDFEFLQDPKDSRAKLGIGSFAVVKLAREKKSGTLFALKQIDLHPSKISEADIQNLKTEIEIHKDLQHPNIIKFHGYIQEDRKLYLILDYASNGNLYTYLHRKKVLTNKEIYKFFFQTCLAVSYLHFNDILHRDIKPENLLLDKDFNIKVCDFGWSAYNLEEGRRTFCGTYEYMAPEILNKKNYDYRIDIWGMGILLYELFHNKAPYQGRSISEIKNSLSKGKIAFNNETPKKAQSLILRILKMDPDNRMSMGQILSDPWVVENLDQDETFRQMPKKKEAVPMIPLGDDNLEMSSSRSRVLNIETSFKKILDSHQLDAPNKLPEKKKHFQSLTPVANGGKNAGVSAFGEALVNDGITSPHSAMVQGSQIFARKKSPVTMKNKTKKIFDEKLLSPSFNMRLKNIFEDLNHKKSIEGNGAEKERLDGGNLASFKIDSKASVVINTPSKYFSIENSRENSESKPSHSGSVQPKYEPEPVNLRKVHSENQGHYGEERKIVQRRQIFQEISYHNHAKDIPMLDVEESKSDLPFGIMQGFAFLKDLWSGPSTTTTANRDQKENSQPLWK